MAVSNGAWAQFMDWNQAIADVCFPEQVQSEPVYLDLDEEIVDALSLKLRTGDRSDFTKRLGVVVKDTLSLGWGPSSVFAPILSQLKKWQTQGSDGPPPTLTLLAALSWAAENMSAGEGVSSNDYYSRLIEVLGLTPAYRQELANAYRASASKLWGSLNDWLDRNEGRRGLKTAKSIGKHSHVGWALSQALIRRVDRDRMRRFFADAALPPGAELRTSELTSLFASWLARPTNAGGNLHRLWNSDDYRPRVAEELCTLFAHWDGRGITRARDSADEDFGCRLILANRTFPRREVSLTALAYIEPADSGRSAELVAGDARLTIELEPEAPGALRFGQGILNSDLLEASIAVRDSLTNNVVRRTPKRLVVFRKDMATSLWMETDGVLPGEELQLACRNDVVSDLETLLAEGARAGYSRLDPRTQGHPEGWTLFRGVQILRSVLPLVPPKRHEFEQLEPLVQTQVQLAGGLQLPQHRSTWLSTRLPEARIIQQDAPGFQVSLIDCVDEDQDVTLETWSDSGTGSVIVDLAELELCAGRYRLEITTTATGETFSRGFSVVDSSLVETEIAAEPSEPTIASPLAVLGVQMEAAEGSTAPSVSLTGIPTDFSLPGRPWWDRRLRPADATLVSTRLPRIEPDSCIFTGAHYFELTPARDARGNWISGRGTGTCKHCGLVKAEQNSYWRNKRRFERKQEKTEASMSRGRSRPSTPTQHMDGGHQCIPWDELADALIFLGEGPWSSFQALARQIDEQGPAIFHMGHTLEAVGLIDVARDPATLEPVSWRITEPSVLHFEDGGIELRGGWSQADRDWLAGVAGQDLTPAVASAEDPLDSEPTVWTVNLDGVDLDLPESRWEELGEQLPVISAVIDALPRRRQTHMGAFQHFHVPSASWISTSRADRPGGYRLRSRGTRDFLRAEQDMDLRTEAASQVRFSKHAACYIVSRRPLLAYNEAKEELTVPLGADLPGLYNRLAVLAGGHAPHRDRSNTVYSGISLSIARLLAHRLSN